MKWQPLTEFRPEGGHSYYLVNHKKMNGEYGRPQVFAWHQLRWYREKNINRQPIITPINQ